MLKDLDYEMVKHGLEGILVLGDTTYGNPELHYVTGAKLPRGGIYVKKCGEEPLLIVSNIDLEGAKKGQVREVRTYSDYRFEELIQRHGRRKGSILLYHEILRSYGLEGRIGVYGRIEVSRAVSISDHLRRFGYRLVGERSPTLLDVLRETKDAFELERIRDVCSRTEKVVLDVMNYLKSCRIAEGSLWIHDKKLTIGEVKRLIRRLLADEGLLATEDIIFTCGVRSADPHSLGEDSDPVKVDEPIVFDIFPQEAGGYWADITRTFVIGNASRELKQMYEAVLEAQLEALDLICDGVKVKDVVNKVCDNFERYGYKTVRDLLKGDKEAQTHGFVHSLGHGVGLTIGEEPYLSLFTEDIFKAGHVVTVEPGLYKPSIGGARIEDVVTVTRRGIENFINLPKELLL